jgi:aspartate aminotransferase-like enzyme
MKTYPIPMIPGPVRVPAEVLAAMAVDYASPDIELEFLDLYNRTEDNLQKIYATSDRILIKTGEGMLALWGALKSTLLPGDRVLSLATGVFGHGIAEMAAGLGAQDEVYALPYDQTLNDWAGIEEKIINFKPKMITAVHCETPSGTLNPIAELGELKHKYNVPLLYVDAVASAGGTPVLTDQWHIDLCLGGSQKVLSAPPLAAFLTVSERAWEISEKVNYTGYDALMPFRNAQANFYFPYTPNWHGVAALEVATGLLLKEGLENVYARHEKVADYCRRRLVEMGLSLFPAPGAVPSPTVTAVYVPEGISWSVLDQRFRLHGLAVGGSYGPLADKVFRIGHMGSQADFRLVQQALDVIERVVGEL